MASPTGGIRAYVPGLLVWTKRLDEGTFSWSRSGEVQAAKLRLTSPTLALLSNDVVMRGSKLLPWYERANACSVFPRTVK